MFGYVNFCHENISPEDREVYKSYYCGLCKEIGKKSQKFRLSLNNDLTFLSIILSAVVCEEPEISKDKRCVAHWFKKHDEAWVDKITEYTSDMNILLVYLKIVDDAADEGKLPSKMLKGILKSDAMSVCEKYPKLSKGIIENLKKLSLLEKNYSNSIDETADCFAKILELLFAPDFILDRENREILKWMGYNIGRWIYIIDAYSDIEKDLKTNSYNPFNQSGIAKDEVFKKQVYDSLTYTLNNIASAYDLLKIYRNDSLIKNILYSGLPMKQESIFKTEDANESL